MMSNKLLKNLNLNKLNIRKMNISSGNTLLFNVNDTFYNLNSDTSPEEHTIKILKVNNNNNKTCEFEGELLYRNQIEKIYGSVDYVTNQVVLYDDDIFKEPEHVSSFGYFSIMSDSSFRGTLIINHRSITSNYKYNPISIQIWHKNKDFKL